jgi:trehalose 6-phosphate synthase
VDRLDYTKGILERFAAIEPLLEVQPGCIDEYQGFEAKVRAAARRVNRRFGRPGYEPIVLRAEHQDASQVYTFYRAADLCFVSSDDERGVLILSQFTGAARELAEALIVNPYDVEQSAAALHLALTMSLGG